jgi:hypothetical protein
MKRFLLLILSLAVLFSFASCKFIDSIFFVAPTVAPSDLTSYAAGGTLPASRDEAVVALFQGGRNLTPLFGFLATNETLATAFGGSTASVFTLIPSVNKMMKAAGMKTVSASQNIYSDSLDKEVHVAIENESVTGTDFGATTGTVIINSLTADVEATTSSNTAPFTGTLKKAEANVDVEASNLDMGDGVILNSAKIGAKAKATGTVSVSSTGSPTSLEYDSSASVKIGFSVSGGATCASGKYIIEASYYDSGSLTESDFQDPSTIPSNFELTVKISVYDNSNDLVDEYTLDQEDLTTYLSGSTS